MNILLPIDGSELALHEVRYALRLVAEGLQARFLLVNVQEPATLYEMVTAPDPVMAARNASTRKTRFHGSIRIPLVCFSVRVNSPNHKLARCCGGMVRSVRSIENWDIFTTSCSQPFPTRCPNGC